MISLVIGRTWDGTLLPQAERTRLRLAYDGDRLRIDVDAPFAGDPAPPGPPGATDRLWEHEVVELFVAGADDHYTEVELSPHGHHLALQLQGVRSVVRSALPLELTTRIDGGRWSGTAWLDRALLPERPARCNAYRIGAGRYEALVAVPGDTPDFHQLDRFVPWPL